MWAVSLPSLNRIMVSFSYFVRVIFIILPFLIVFHAVLAILCLTATHDTLKFQLQALSVDCRIGGRIGTPAGMQEGKMKKAPLAGAFFDGLFSPLVCSLWSGLYER